MKRWGPALVVLVTPLLFAPADAAAPSTAPASAADAYGLWVDTTLTPLNVPVQQGPLARATQESPPQAAAPAEAQLLGAGPLPPGGELVQHIGVLTSVAGANATPQAVAASQAVDVRLLSQAGVPLITADVLRAQSTTDCVNAPSAAGTEFVNLRVAGATDPIPTPAPNTELLPQIFNPLGLKVILNEQHPTADGRGLVVNAIHIYNVAPATVPGLFTGDVVVAHAMSTVNCPNGAGSTGDDNDVVIVKNADRATAAVGDTITYTATVQNTSAATCPVNRLVDHLPAPFQFVSTSGAFGTIATTAARPGGGTDVVVEPVSLVIPAGGSATQTFVVKVADNAAPGVYFNNVELFCANLGNWVKGLDAPVEVVAADAAPTTTSTSTTSTTEPPLELGEVLASTGGWSFGAGALLGLAGGVLVWVRRRLP